MKRPSEETLNAYADRALDDAAADQVTAYLVHDPEARAYVAELRRVNALAASAMDALIPGPTPKTLIDSVMSAQGNVVPVTEVTKRAATARYFSEPLRYILPMAAAVVLTLGLGLTYALIGENDTRANLLPSGPIKPASALAALLDTGRSGDKPVALDDPLNGNAKASVAATFRDGSGRFCREIEVTSGDDAQSLSASIACRTGPGSWLVEGSVRLATNERVGTPGFEPSGSKNDEPLVPLLNRLGVGSALTSAEEESALTSKWQ